MRILRPFGGRNITLTEPVPHETATITGDCIHNLRSALDHWVHDYSVSEAGREVRDTGFPLHAKEDRWDDRPIRKLPLDVREVIRTYQPFEQAFTVSALPRHQLRDLHRLDIKDKHRTLNVVATNMDVIGWGVPEGSKGEVRYRVFKDDLELNTPQPMC